MVDSSSATRLVNLAKVLEATTVIERRRLEIERASDDLGTANLQIGDRFEKLTSMGGLA